MDANEVDRRDMSRTEINGVRRVAKCLHHLAEAFPDLRYVELSGTAIRDDDLTDAALRAFIGNADCTYQHNPKSGVAYAVYGANLHEAVAELSVITDQIWLAVRSVLWHANEGGGDQELTDAEFPAVRESGVPFTMIHAVLGMAIEFPRALETEFARFGANIRLTGRGGVGVHIGEVTVEDGCLVFPDSLYVPRAAATEGSRGTGAVEYRRVLAAVTREKLTAVYSLSSLFSLLGALFDSYLKMVRFGRQIERDHICTNPSREDAGPTDADLLAPSKQASMLGWAEPNSNPTLKRLGALRKAVVTQGMTLDARKIPGKGNKTFVPHAQWIDVVKFYEFVAHQCPNPDQAIAAIGQGVRLTNTTGRPVSYLCRACAETTRTEAAQPACGTCGKHEHLQPLTRLREK